MERKMEITIGFSLEGMEKNKETTIMGYIGTTHDSLLFATSELSLSAKLP